MLGFEVHLNGQRVAASIEQGVLTVILTNRNMHEEDSIYLDVGGLDTNSGVSQSWLHATDLKEGDEIVVHIKKVDNVTESVIKRTDDAADLKKQRMDMYYKFKAELEKDGLI